MGNLGKVVTIGISVAILVLAITGSVVLSENNIVRKQGLWSDATDVLSGQAAEQAGREARPPFINTEQGNMLAFFFALGGVAAGLTIGYNWRRLLAAEARGRRQRGRLTVTILMAITYLVVVWVHAFLKPLVDPSLGDVVLFIFVLVGAVSGFITGSGLGRLKTEQAERRKLAT
jgi:uncharacterized membrane protein (DUF485 family)